MPRGAVDCEQCDGTGIVVCECCGGEQQTDGEPCDCAAPEWRPIAGHQYCKACGGNGWYIPEIEHGPLQDLEPAAARSGTPANDQVHLARARET
jgi:hypothetical protein